MHTLSTSQVLFALYEAYAVRQFYEFIMWIENVLIRKIYDFLKVILVVLDMQESTGKCQLIVRM